jgi:APA family basic amino acid/polyamine antiporter
MAKIDPAVPAVNGQTASGFVRALGLWDSVSLIMGIMIGSGIFLMAGSIALQLDSLTAVVGVWAFGGVLSLCGAAALSELGAALPAAGGLYVYLTTVYGRGVGFVYGWSAMALIHAGSIATLAAAIGLYAAPILGLTPGQQKLFQLACIAFFVGLNCLGLGVGKWVQNALTLIKVVGIAAMTMLLYSRGHTGLLLGQWTPSESAMSWSSFGVALVAVLWAYDGWHFVSFTAGEVKDPGRTLPRSLLIGTGLTFIIYLVVNVAYYAVLPADVIRGTDRVAAAAVEQAFGSSAALLISALIAISIVGSMNGIILGAPRVNWAMAHDGLFFRSFARVNTRFHTPIVATIAQGACAAAFTLVGSFQQLFTSYVFTSWIFYGLAVAGVIILRRRQPELPRPYLCPLYPATPIFFLVATTGIVISTFVANFWQAALGIGLILAGVPLYFVFRAIERRNVRAAGGSLVAGAGVVCLLLGPATPAHAQVVVAKPVPVESAAAPSSSTLTLSGDVRVRYEHTTTEGDTQDRDRGVMRTRMKAAYKPNAYLEVGVRVTTGDPANPRTTDVTFDDFAHKLDVSLDQAYIKAHRGGLTVGGGRLPNPFVGTELVWDGDVNTPGVSGELALPRLGRLSPSLTSMLFVVDEREAATDSRMVGTQLAGKTALSDAWTLTLAAAYYDYNMVTLNTSDVRGNRLTADGTHYLSDFDLVTVLGKLNYRGSNRMWPVTLTTEFVENTGAADSDQQGFDVELDAGRSRVKGAHRARYGFMTADRDAVLAAFSHDNTPLATAYRMHTFAWDWYPRANYSTNVTVYVYRSTLANADPYQTRLRMNFTVEF